MVRRFPLRGSSSVFRKVSYPNRLEECTNTFYFTHWCDMIIRDVYSYNNELSPEHTYCNRYTKQKKFVLVSSIPRCFQVRQKFPRQFYNVKIWHRCSVWDFFLSQCGSVLLSLWFYGTLQNMYGSFYTGLELSGKTHTHLGVVMFWFFDIERVGDMGKKRFTCGLWNSMKYVVSKCDPGGCRWT